MKHEEIRSYEVSIWTLQDEFITVLKWSNIEHKGTILDPKFTSVDDGTLNFSFTIPMYIRQEGQLVENPLWYNTLNGNLIANLKKIKIIFNKNTADEEVVELLITKVTEEHEQDHVFCNIECEGLAFNELGKIGYTYDISSADLEYDYLQWLEKGAWFKPDGTQVTTNPPVGNILYWCEKIGLAPLPASENDVDPRKWYYYIDMNWDSFSDGRTRNKHKMYEEPYEAGWSYDENTGKVISHTIVETREKERTIEAKESNIYNITLTIAETFGVFCRYKYYHDNNYHITKKVIIFFNNYLYDLNIMSFTYPYSSKKVTREMDSSAVTTKLYVRSLEDTTTLLGEANIRYCEANKMQEDYILNFDYLKESGNMTLELYDAVSEYEDAIHRVNAALYPVENKINVYENEVNDLKAKQAYYTNAIELDKEQITLNSDLALSLTVSDGLADLYISSFDNQHPDYTIITTDELDKYCIKLNTKVKGIRADSVEIYRNYASSTNVLSNKLDKFYFVYDEEYGFPTRIYGEDIAPTSNSYAVYMTYDYEPRLYYDAIVKTWEERLATDEKNLADITKQLSNDPENGGDENAPLGVELALEEAREELQELIQQKKDIMAEFNYDMGPALREGYWQPEKYIDYGERYLLERSLSTSYDSTFVSASTGNLYSVGWDTNLLDNEQDIYYEISINQNKVYYPCVNLTSFLSNSTFLENLDKYSFIFYNNYYDNLVTLPNVKYIRSFSIGSEAILGFVKNSAGNVFPALILVGAKNMTTDDSIVEGGTIGFMLDSARGLPRLGMLTTTVSGNTITATETNVILLNSEDYFKFGTDTIDQCVAVMPRLKFSSLMLKTSEDTLFVRYNNTLLKNYYDYYITNRLIQSEVYAPEYFITIKPFTLIKTGVLNGTFNTSYVLSNASTAIYLDALEVAEENSKPKVSYTVDPNILDRNLTRILYEKLNWVVMINDVQLKFNNVFGYISKLELDLDFPDKDAIEVKNYVTKFEDLFSTIVAQTEAMKQSSGIMGTIMAGDLPLSNEGLEQTLENESDTLEEYLDNYIDLSEKFEAKLASLFTEAGSILASTSRSMRDVNSLTAENAEILGGFVLNINKELTPLIYKSNTKPSTYKLGDVWILTDDAGNVIGEYVATSSSGLFAADTETSGFARTADGTLASITGASLDINADGGNIALLAKNNIEIKSGGYLYLASENVDIVGNLCVNIGGAQINIVSLTKGSTTYLNGGINLIAGSYNANGLYADTTSRVLLRNNSIEMGAATLTFKAASSINMIASTGDFANSSAIKISANDGVWIGAGKSITLFSGRDTTGASGSSVLINTERILMGVTNDTATSVFDLTPGYLIMGVGTTANNFANNNVTLNSADSGSITGMKLTKDSFGLAIGANNNRTVILANSSGFIVGAGNTPEVSHTYVKVTGGGVEIGSNGILDVKTTNFLIDSSAPLIWPEQSDDPNAEPPEDPDPMFRLGTAADYAMLYLGGILTIKGSMQVLDNGSSSSLSDWVNAKITPELIWLGVVKHTTGNENATIGSSTSLSLTDSAFTVSSTGSFTVNSGTVFITSDNVIIDTDADDGESILLFKNGNIDYFKVSKDEYGNISALLGGWNITTGRLFSGSSTNYVALDSGAHQTLAMWAGKENPDDTFTGQTVTVDGTSYNVISSRGAPFRVTRNGRVYMDKLMLWDSENHIYKEIDFSDFNLAVSLKLKWNGPTVEGKASFWGKFSTSVTSSLTVRAVTGTLTGRIGLGRWTGRFDLIVNADDGSTVINETNLSGLIVGSEAEEFGWNAAAQAVSPKVLSGTETEINIPAYNGYNSTTTPISLTPVHDQGARDGWSAAVSAGGNWSDRTLSAGLTVHITVPSSYGSTTSFTVTAASGTCFIGGSKVKLLNNAEKPIEELTVGEEVLAYDEINNQFVSTEVIAVQMFKNAIDIAEIQINNNSIFLTKSHVVFTNNGWKALDVLGAKRENPDLTITLLELTDKLMDEHGNLIDIIAIIDHPEMDGTTVYNIDVEPYDTYIVEGIVVHNADEKGT